MKFKYKYLADDTHNLDKYVDEIEDAYPFESNWEVGEDYENECIAEAAAEHHYSNGEWHKGERVFMIFNEDNSLIGTFSVDVEYWPSFSGTRLKESTDATKGEI